MPNPPSPPKTFAAIGAAVFLIAAGALGYMNGTRSVSQLTALGEDYNTTLAAALLNAARGELEPLLRAAVSMDEDELKRDPRPAALREVVLRLTEGTRIAKVEIYSTTGSTVFSSDPSQIGAARGLTPRLRAALAGRTMSEIERGEDFVDFQGQRAAADLLSSSLPVRARDGQIVGVFELDTDVTALKSEIESTEVFNIAILVLCFGAIYGLLLGAAAAGSRAIARKHQENLELAAAMRRAEEADRAKSEFLANMSHQLRTPLNAIIGFSEIIKDQCFGPVEPARYRDCALDIHDAGRHLLGIIDDVLDLVKIEAGGARPAITEVDPARIVETVMARARGQAEAADVNLSVRLPQTLPLIATDPRCLERILSGFLSSAIRLTPQGGRVCLRALWNEAADGIEISVSDTGIGIAPEDIPATLARFGQVDGVANSKRPGAGLGLPLAKRLAEVLGGEIEIQSRFGQGTEVTIRLPRSGRGDPTAAKRTAA